MPLFINDLINSLTTNLKVSDYCVGLSLVDIACINSFLTTNLVMLIELCDAVKKIEKDGIILPHEIIEIVLLTHEIIVNFIKAKSMIKVNFMNVEKFILETLFFKVLTFPEGVGIEMVQEILNTCLKLIALKPKIKFSFWTRFFLAK